MGIKSILSQRSGYLGNKPKIINWVVIAGPPVDYIQSFDLIFDDKDLKIRKIDKKFKDI